MVKKEHSISVIIPNYNGKHLLEMYLPSTLKALSYSNLDFEIIIVDDCSTDQSITFITEHYKNCKLIKNAVNSGFSYTCNQGIAVASKTLVFLLNTDVKLEENYFEHQFKYFNDNDTFGVMGRIMNMEGQKIEDAARFPYFKGSKFKANTFYYIEDNQNRTLTSYLSGANALVDRAKLLELGGFDEIYTPFYFEDFDLGLRAWKLGFKLYYEHQSVCYHQVSSSTNKMNNDHFVQITYHRNSFILQQIHLSGSRLLFWQLQLYTIILIGHLLKGEFWILKSIGGFLKKKNEINQSRNTLRVLQQKFSLSNNLSTIISEFQKSIKGKNIKWL